MQITARILQLTVLYTGPIIVLRKQYHELRLKVESGPSTAGPNYEGLSRRNPNNRAKQAESPPIRLPVDSFQELRPSTSA